jgi:hypothetical protein
VDSVRRPAAAATRARRGWGSRFLLLALIWGLSSLFIKLGEEGLAAPQVALGRMLAGTATLAVILGVRRERLPCGWRTCSAPQLHRNDCAVALETRLGAGPSPTPLR